MSVYNNRFLKERSMHALYTYRLLSHIHLYYNVQWILMQHHFIRMTQLRNNAVLL